MTDKKQEAFEKWKDDLYQQNVIYKGSWKIGFDAAFDIQQAKINVLVEALKEANHLLDTIPYGAMTKYQTCGDTDAIAILEAWDKKREALKQAE